MFSGLIRFSGTVASNQGNRIAISSVPLKAKLGDSIAVNGICLTVTRTGKGTLTFDVSSETRSKTTIAAWKKGKKLNVEPALRASDALGGHIVQGHVDGVAHVERALHRKDSREVWFSVPRGMESSVVPKGSVTIDGVSLTVIAVKRGKFAVSLVPFTLKHTNLHFLKSGDPVNFEADVIGKYVAAYMAKLGRK